MNLYLKILGFLKPFWKLIIVSTLLTFLYVIFNSVSLWVSVDFVRELFTPDMLEQQAEKPDKPAAVNRSVPDGQITDLKSKFDVYQKLNRAIKGLIIQEDRFDTLKMVCLVIFLSFFMKNVTFYFRRVMISFIELNVVVNIRDRLQKALIYQPISYFEKHHSGKLTSIVFNDVKSVNTVLNDSFGKMLLTPVQIMVNVALMFVFSWKLSLFTFIVVPISGLIIVKIGQSIRRKSRRVFQQISNVMSTFQEAVSAIRIVKAFTAETRETEKFQKENNRYFRLHFRSKKLNFITSPLNETLAAFMLIGLLWYGGHMVYANAGLNAEKFVRFLVFLFASFHPLKEFSGINNTIQTGMAAAERIFGIIDAPPEVYELPDSKKFETIRNEICYHNLFFRYSSENPDVLRNVDFCVPKGQMVALVGPSGSGKTTLVNLLLRFHDVDRGEIRIDGTDIRKFTLTSLREKMGLVTQDSILFNDTIRANIAYGDIRASENEIIEAARVANALEFIERMENGLDSLVGEKGVKLSGGQKQRISIARAILKNPPILILDEATSALDTESERLVQDAIDNLMKNRTVVVIAHRLSTVINADKIIVMQQGRLVGQGKHRELLKTCPLYKMLYEMQFMDNVEVS
ncbi:ABC transporter ATP-binding protein [bacterium]|nr:ABC transporter ATP-binding protein [bacterium]